MIDAKLRPSSEKIILAEIDIGTLSDIAFNYSAGVNYEDMDGVYSRIDGAYLSGVSPKLDIITIGSMSSDAAQLLLVPDIATVEAIELSFFWDAADRALYYHLQNGDRASLHRIIYGITYGVSDKARIFNGLTYDGTLKSAPNIEKSKDPLFWGMIANNSWDISIGNTDRKYDKIPEERDLFGNMVRLFGGFEGQSYSELTKCGVGLIGNVSRSSELFKIAVMDKRTEFSQKVPFGVFDATTYPDIDPGNVGKTIPLTYGVLRQIPVICTNQNKSPAPANYTFRFSDTTLGTGTLVHPIKAITQVYVDGVAKSTSASDLNAGTFSIAAANYSPGQKVTMDLQGYADAGGVLVENALDVLLDILSNCLSMPNIPALFDQAEWEVARAGAPNICYFTKAPVKVADVIKDICSSSYILFFAKNDGRYTARIYSANRSVSHSFSKEDNIEDPSIDDDKEQVIASTRVGYSRNWSEDDEYIWLNDTSKRTDIFLRWKSAEEGEFPTLLTNETDAQAFSDKILALGGQPQKIAHFKFKMQALGLEIGDFIEAWLVRQDGTGLLGQVKAEIISISFDMLEAEFSIDARIVEIYGERTYVQGTTYWGDAYYGQAGKVYGISQMRRVA